MVKNQTSAFKCKKSFASWRQIKGRTAAREMLLILKLMYVKVRIEFMNHGKMFFFLSFFTNVRSFLSLASSLLALRYRKFCCNKKAYKLCFSSISPTTSHSELKKGKQTDNFIYRRG